MLKIFKVWVHTFRLLLAKIWRRLFNAKSAPKKAVCLFFQREDGKILAVSRRNDFTRFGLPGGKVDGDETSEAALIREILEETGLEVTDPKPVFSALCQGKVDYISTTYYCGQLKGDPHTDEPISIEWVTPQVLLDGPFGEYNKKLFDHLGIVT